MTNWTSDEKSGLAFRYVHGGMEAREKGEVFRLIQEDEEFRLCLRDEVVLKGLFRMQQERPDSAWKNEMLRQIKISAEGDAKRGQAAQGTAPRGSHRLRRLAGIRPFAGIAGAKPEPEWIRYSEWILQRMIPPLVYPAVKFLQRRWLT